MNTIWFNETSTPDTLVHNPETVFDAWKYWHHLANTAYPINHVKTVVPYYRIKNSLKDAFTQSAWEWIDSFGLYAHIPFCAHRCYFCEYTVLDPKTYHNEDAHSSYTQALKKEIQMYAERTSLWWKKIRWFDIGGWTPSAIEAKHIEEIISQVDNSFHLPQDTNISIETTPEIAAQHPERIQAYNTMWINRISMWVQSINPRILAQVWRTNTSVDRNKKAIDHIRNAWFDSFNIDIMYGLIWQKIESVKATLQHVFSLNPEHITIYRTRYKGTKVAEKWYKVQYEDIQNQAKLIKNMLKDAWYDALTGKNTFSKVAWSSWASRYLTERVVNWTPYLWVWLGAQSLTPHILSYNQWAWSKDIKNYLRYIDRWEFPIQDMNHLSPEMSAGKFISVSFYFWWIHLPSFQKNYGCSVKDMFPDKVAYVLENWYMRYQWDRLQLTEKWVESYSWVISLFYAASVQSYLIGKERIE